MLFQIVWSHVVLQIVELLGAHVSEDQSVRSLLLACLVMWRKHILFSVTVKIVMSGDGKMNCW